MKQSIGERLEEVKKAHNLTNVALSAIIKTDNSTVGKIISGKNNVTAEMLLELYARLGVDLNWLLTGEGAMEIKKSGEVPDSVTIVMDKRELERVRASLDVLCRAFEGVAPSDGAAAPVVQHLPLGKRKTSESVKGSDRKSTSGKG